jgi:hypothetical protein
MNTSILTVVLTSTLLAGQNGISTWQNDYSMAQKQAATQKKPLVVVFGSGLNGWTKVVRETPTPDIHELLADSYICVYVDTADPTGRRLAQQFDLTGDIGLVISDASGTSQAFWHQGDLTTEKMRHFLQKYASPQATITRTETVNPIRMSFYPSESPQGGGPPPAVMRSRSC